MRTFRSRTTVLAAAGATAALALSLTACGGGSGVKASGTGGSGGSGGSVSVSSSKSPGASASSEAGASAAKSGGSQASPASDATGAAPVCAAKDLSISAARHNGPPYTHIVLTAKNTSGHSCKMTGYPEIQFLESHRENVPPVAKSKPAASVVLKAGAPAYALVRLSDGGTDEDNEIVNGFSVTLQGGGGMAAVTAPGKGGIAVDPAKWATGYWTYELRNGADDF
ncbi:DUF4232 domain-containing protein [Streptomyces alboniger]|uniref:DUF4232 domain-containing protein n=1 Tax=Streptomyces alboniger TaxID=132473 RepID=A0A5J6HL58_STRAD|nr:DUF4232 domain-containing protein [Streptomyces alboniger]QEV19193.1 DUF4232 domain-containing protein [Streptomyces alboniger]